MSSPYQNNPPKTANHASNQNIIAQLFDPTYLLQGTRKD